MFTVVHRRRRRSWRWRCSAASSTRSPGWSTIRSCSEKPCHVSPPSDVLCRRIMLNPIIRLIISFYTITTIIIIVHWFDTGCTSQKKSDILLWSCRFTQMSRYLYLIVKTNLLYLGNIIYRLKIINVLSFVKLTTF